MTAPPLPVSESCRNCGAPVAGDYCANCGQETRVELPAFRTFIRDAAGRYVALDGRFWRTLYALVARPGFLTLEYFAGRRRRYIRPARLFLVTSVLLFAIIGFVSTPHDVGDEIVFTDTDPVDGGAGNASGIGLSDTQRETRIGLDKDMNLMLRFGGRDVLPEALKARYARFKSLSGEQKSERIYAGIVRFGPYSMVALLPAFAFLLELAYLGSGRRYPGRPQRYAEHLVYSAHLHAFMALILATMVLIPIAWIRFLLGAWIVIYVLRARQIVYRGRWWAGVLRGFLIAMIYTVLISLAMIGLLIAAVLLR